MANSSVFLIKTSAAMSKALNCCNKEALPKLSNANDFLWLKTQTFPPKFASSTNNLLVSFSITISMPWSGLSGKILKTFYLNIFPF